MTRNGELMTLAEKKRRADRLLEPLDVCSPRNENAYDGFSFKHYFVPDQGTQISIKIEEQYVLMQFCIQGRYSLKNAKQKKLASLKQTDGNIFFLGHEEVYLNTLTTATEWIDLSFKKDFLNRHIPIDFPAKLFFTDRFKALFPKNISLSAKLKVVLNELLHCDFEPHLKMLYTKAKMIELLTLLFVQHKEEKNSTSLLKPGEIEKMMLIKDLIENDSKASHTLASLARAVGTNEQYLKMHFKLVFNNTVFGHMRTFKMQKAKEMLLTGKYKITEIAEMVGYKHATHFTSTFKKFFGYLPQTLKTKLLFGSYFSLNFELELLNTLLRC